MINSVKVKPCRTIDKVIESKDFKRVLNIIFVEIQKDIVVQAEIENFLIMQKSFDRLLSNKPLNKDELEIIKDFCNEALNKKSKIYQKIIKVLKRVEVHSFLDNFNCILL
ncbi:TPA: hypothetical protein DEG21_04405 [Patescibacteria group bacterium]|nr:hypothetical protein [Candidatus Gracilibacteria bacterium]HBY75078.1 hypothetical protein [Candidatus Gracilibacteria bacterium]